MGRMTKSSKTNLVSADSCGITPGASGYLVWVGLCGSRVYLHDSGGPMEYPSFALARRAIKRVRADLEPVSYPAVAFSLFGDAIE